MLGDLEREAVWYGQILAFYTIYANEKVIDFLKKKMLKFYQDCSFAWQKLLDRRVSASPRALARALLPTQTKPNAPPPRDENISD